MQPPPRPRHCPVWLATAPAQVVHQLAAAKEGGEIGKQLVAAQDDRCLGTAREQPFASGGEPLGRAERRRKRRMLERRIDTKKEGAAGLL